MKRIESAAPGATWHESLVKQLGYIKKHLRYPLGKSTVRPALLLSAMMPAIAFLIYTVLFTKSTSSAKPVWLPAILICAVVILPAIVIARWYWQTLHFMAVPARYAAAGNILLLQQFLHANHFAVGRHPQMPEVFQITSKSRGIRQTEQEIVILIADDQRILINSHFIQNRFFSPIGISHHHEIARMLTTWLRKEEQLSAGAELQRF